MQPNPNITNDSISDFSRFPEYADAVARKDVHSLSKMLVANVTSTDGVIILNEWGKIVFGVAIEGVGAAVRGAVSDGMLTRVAAHIKPFEGVGTGSIVRPDPEKLTAAIRACLAEITA